MSNHEFITKGYEKLKWDFLLFKKGFNEKNNETIYKRFTRIFQVKEKNLNENYYF